MIRDLFMKYRMFILYLVFGVLTTIVNIGCYYFCFNICGIQNVISTVIAWLIAVVFAFFTNKFLVFESKNVSRNIFIREFLTFFLARIATGVLDVLIMWVSVDVLQLNPMLWKIVSNILVIILNFVSSKFFIFIKGHNDEKVD